MLNTEFLELHLLPLAVMQSQFHSSDKNRQKARIPAKNAKFKEDDSRLVFYIVAIVVCCC